MEKQVILFNWNLYYTVKDVYFIDKWVHDYHVEKRVEWDYMYASFALSF